MSSANIKLIYPNKNTKEISFSLFFFRESNFLNTRDIKSPKATPMIMLKKERPRN